MTESKPIRILYMEDDPGLARLVQKKLERAGYVVDLACDGEEGLAMYAAGSYDVLAVDQVMPVHDGLGVIRTLASQGSLPPTIMVTGTGSEKIAVEAIKLGARDYIVKDVDGGYLDLLPTVIEQALQQQRFAEEKQRAEEALQRRNLELAALNAVGDVITSTLDLRTMQNLIIDKAVELLQAEAGSLWLVDRDTGELVCEITADPDSADLVGTRLPPGTGVVGAVVQEGKPIIVGEAQTDRRWYRGFDDHTAFTTRSIIAVPMVSRGRTIGAIELLNRRDGVAFTDDDERLLTAIGQQIGVAVENARLFAETRARGHQTELLLSASETAVSTLDSTQVLRRVARAVARAIGADMTGAYLLDEGGTALRPVAGYHVPPERLEAFMQFQIPLKGHSFVEDAWQNKQAVFTSEAGNDLRLDAQTRQLFQATSVLLIPMIVKGEIIGGLWAVWWEEAHRFTEEELRLGEGIVRQAAIAIENARLFEETQRRASQAALTYEVGRRVSGELEPGELLPAIVTAVYDAFDYYGVMLMLLDEEAECLTLQSIAGGYADIFPNDLWLAIGEGMIGYAAATGETQVSGDVSKDPHYVRKAAEVTKSELVVPIKSGQEVIGVLDIQSDNLDAFDEMDLMAMETLADQIAVAIKNAGLFGETRRRVRELRLLHDVGLAAASGVGLEKTLQAAAVALAVELQGNNVALMLLDAEGGTLRMEASVGYPPGVIEDLRLRLGEGITGWVAQHGEPALVPDVRLDPRYYEGDSNTRSELCVPLTADSRVIGVINVESAQPGVFTDDDQRLLSTLASNLVVLIERARLFEEVEAARMESQQRAEALEEANVRLRELDRLKSEFLANMSHELRTPLNSVIGFSEVLIDGLVGEVSSEQEECLGNIRSSGKHLLALINDILDLSKIEAGRVELKMATFDVAGLLAEVQVTIRPLIEKKSQVLKIERAEGLPLLTADRFRIKQVLLNLLSNAHKFTLVEGHITLSCRLVDQATMLFSVTDTGIGIKPEDQRVIFEEFRQADGSASREITGTGLGLAISKRLVEMHGGRIWVESEYGHGATFSVLLPLDGSWAPEAGAAEETALVSEGKTVLVVEDDRQFSDLLAFYLRQEGYIPVRHYNGVGVLDKARELKPALITLDIMLPDQDGWEVLRALKSDPLTKDIPVLVISALEDGELAFSLGAVDYLVKPIGRDDLHRLLNRLAAPDPLTRHITILAVDDDPGVIKLLQQMLPADSCTLLAAYDGQQGLSLARSEHPDVILLDLLMPGMNGFEVLEALRADAETAGIPVFVLTAKEVTEGERELLNDHIQGLMRKGALTPKSLLAELCRLETLALQPEGCTRARTPQAGPEACR